MPLELSEEATGRYLVIRATGKLVEEDYKTFIPKFERLAPHTKKFRMLFDIRGLLGWNPSAAWEDIKFDVKHYSDIERLAIVGEKPWQHGLATLFAPFTKATTRYFDTVDAAAAAIWLKE